MNEFIPPFDLVRFFLEPWSTDSFSTTMWSGLMGFFVAASCGLIGNYLILRRMALVGDAISHSILPGIAVAFLFSNSRGTIPMMIGALAAGFFTTFIIEIIHRKTRVKQDAAIGIAFTTLFAIGVILISLFASRIDLDQECVLYGEIAFVNLSPDRVELFGKDLGPVPVVRMGILTVLTILGIWCFYKELLVSSFDPGLAVSLGINAALVHYSLMSWLSVVVVSAFESVGAILVIAMLILPGATGTLLSERLPVVMLWTVISSAISSFVGIHLATWLNCSMAGAMVVVASGLFVLAWCVSPLDGLGRKLRQWRTEPIRPPEAEQV
jgi:manganese/zinc/iron transport system permease protein